MNATEIYEMQKRIGNTQKKFIEAQSECVELIVDMLESTKSKRVVIFDKDCVAENSFIPLVERTPFAFEAITEMRADNGLLIVTTCKIGKNWEVIKEDTDTVTIIPDIERGLQDIENADWWFILDTVHDMWEEEIEEEAKHKVKKIFGEE